MCATNTDTNGPVSVFWARFATIKTKLVQFVTLHPRPATFTTTSNIILFWEFDGPKWAEPESMPISNSYIVNTKEFADAPDFLGVSAVFFYSS
jgi:hypothetical protein